MPPARTRGSTIRRSPPVDSDMRLRTLIQQALDSLALSASDIDARMPRSSSWAIRTSWPIFRCLRARRARETDSGVRRALDESISMLQLDDPSPAVEAAAAERLGAGGAMGAVDALEKLDKKPGAARPAVKAAAKRPIAAINQHIWVVNFYGTIFRGVSLGSILLVAALGLAITFGLMGVINMAHGEMIAVGAYACYFVQNIFRHRFRLRDHAAV